MFFWGVAVALWGSKVISEFRDRVVLREAAFRVQSGLRRTGFTEKTCSFAWVTRSSLTANGTITGIATLILADGVELSIHALYVTVGWSRTFTGRCRSARTNKLFDQLATKVNLRHFSFALFLLNQIVKNKCIHNWHFEKPEKDFSSPLQTLAMRVGRPGVVA